MLIFSSDLLKNLKKSNIWNLIFIIIGTIAFGVILFILIYYQSRELQTLFVILATIVGALYLFFVWALIYASIIPIHHYVKVINNYYNYGAQKLTLEFIGLGDITETIKRIECTCLKFKFTDSENEIHFYTEKSQSLDLKEGEIYTIKYREYFIGECIHETGI